MNAIVYDQPDEEYRKAEGFNASGLKNFIRSPAHFKASLDEPQEYTPALVKGILFHHLLLTPNAPLRVAIKPAGLDGRKPEGKAWKMQHEGMPICDQEDLDSCQRMVNSIRNHPNAAAAFGMGKPEVSVFHEYKCLLSGDMIQLKGRMDFVNDGAAIVDAKTCEDARPASFASAAVDFGYFWQATIYLHFLWNPVCRLLGKPELQKTDFVFVAVEKTPPYATKCFCVGAGVYNLYIPKIEEELMNYNKAKLSGFYPAYPTDVAILTPPEWGVRREVNNAMKLEATIENPIAK
jgi:exodeoxyribonuclease VIII